MPTLRKPGTCSPLRPWHARAKRDNLEWSLGYYATKEEAEEQERLFALQIPSRKHSDGKQSS